MPQIVKTKIIREEISVLATAQERLRKLNLQVRQEVETAIRDAGRDKPFSRRPWAATGGLRRPQDGPTIPSLTSQADRCPDFPP
jgi:hypothetical protein